MSLTDFCSCGHVVAQPRRTVCDCPVASKHFSRGNVLNVHRPACTYRSTIDTSNSKGTVAQGCQHSKQSTARGLRNVAYDMWGRVRSALRACDQTHKTIIIIVVFTKGTGPADWLWSTHKCKAQSSCACFFCIRGVGASKLQCRLKGSCMRRNGSLTDECDILIRQCSQACAYSAHRSSLSLALHNNTLLPC